MKFSQVQEKQDSGQVRLIKSCEMKNISVMPYCKKLIPLIFSAKPE